MPKDSYGLEIGQYRIRIFGVGGCSRVFDSWCEDCLGCCDEYYHKCLRAVLMQTPHYVCEDGDARRMTEEDGLTEEQADKIIEEVAAITTN
jgi:hypothetical protein